MLIASACMGISTVQFGHQMWCKLGNHDTSTLWNVLKQHEQIKQEYMQHNRKNTTHALEHFFLSYETKMSSEFRKECLIYTQSPLERLKNWDLLSFDIFDHQALQTPDSFWVSEQNKHVCIAKFHNLAHQKKKSTWMSSSTYVPHNLPHKEQARWHMCWLYGSSLEHVYTININHKNIVQWHPLSPTHSSTHL